MSDGNAVNVGRTGAPGYDERVERAAALGIAGEPGGGEDATEEFPRFVVRQFDALRAEVARLGERVKRPAENQDEYWMRQFADVYQRLAALEAGGGGEDERIRNCERVVVGLRGVTEGNYDSTMAELRAVVERIEALEAGGGDEERRP